MTLPSQKELPCNVPLRRILKQNEIASTGKATAFARRLFENKFMQSAMVKSSSLRVNAKFLTDCMVGPETGYLTLSQMLAIRAHKLGQKGHNYASSQLYAKALRHIVFPPKEYHPEEYTETLTYQAYLAGECGMQCLRSRQFAFARKNFQLAQNVYSRLGMKEQLISSIVNLINASSQESYLHAKLSEKHAKSGTALAAAKEAASAFRAKELEAAKLELLSIEYANAGEYSESVSSSLLSSAAWQQAKELSDASARYLKEAEEQVPAFSIENIYSKMWKTQTD